MKKLMSLIVMLGMAAPVYAIAERTDNSMTLVYAFLAVCGMIIFLQIIPVLLVVYGFVKGMFGKKVIETGNYK